MRKSLNISSKLKILLVIALGRPLEKIILEDLKKNNDTRYYRDKNDFHHVPKRRIEELIIE